MNAQDRILKSKIIAIIRGQGRENLFKIADALYNGGVSCMEITYNSSKPETDEETAKTLSMLIEKFGDKMSFGSGTVLNERQVELTRAAGGEFIISPNVNVNVIKKTKELGLLSIPGAYSPSECQLACEAGADYVKLFPVVNLGADYLKAIAAPLSHIKFMAVGGVTAENLVDYMKAGAVGIGTGGDLVNKEAVKNGEFDKITERAKQYVKAIKTLEEG